MQLRAKEEPSQLDQHRPQTRLAVFSLTGSLIPVQHQDRAEPPLLTAVKTVMTGEPPCPPPKSKLTCSPIPPPSPLGGQDLYPIPTYPGGIDIGDKSYSMDSIKFTPHIITHTTSSLTTERRLGQISCSHIIFTI